MKKIPAVDILLRRNLKLEPHNYIQKTVYIEAEILQALAPHDDLNYMVNRELLDIILKRQAARQAAQVLKADPQPMLCHQAINPDLPGPWNGY
jgi:hypothetical protein